MSKKRKVYAIVKTRLILEVNDDFLDPVDDILTNMDYRFSYNGDEGEVIDHEIFEHYEEA
jgi:hypothetical protein